MHEQTLANPIRLTYQDYCALPEDGMRYEILNGDLFMSPSPQTHHQRVVGRLFRILSDHVESRGLGEVFVAPFDVLLGEHDIVEPDLIFVATANRTIVTEKHIRGAPDLLVEIVSSTRPDYDVRDKRAVYARCTVPWYWTVEPEHRRLTELRLVGGAYQLEAESVGETTFRPALFSGLSIPLSRLWA